MNCFIHDRTAAVGFCALCQKGVCRECVGRETPGLVCRSCVQGRDGNVIRRRSSLCAGGLAHGPYHQVASDHCRFGGFPTTIWCQPSFTMIRRDL